MPVSAIVRNACTVVETFTDASLSANDKTLTHNAFDRVHSLTAATTPPVTKVAAFTLALVAGEAEIDLTNLTGSNGGPIDGTGLKVQVLKVNATSTNANPITFEAGDSNGYTIGAVGWVSPLLAGQEWLHYGNEGNPDVAAGAKIIKVTGTGTQSAQVLIVLG